MKKQTKQIPNEWKKVELGSVAEFKRGPFGSSVQKSECIIKGKNTYKLYEQGNVINNDFERGSYYLSTEKFEKLKGFEIKSGDILITCAGTLGKIAIVPEKIEKGIINSVLMRIRIDKKAIDRDYFLYFFKSSNVQNDIQSKSAGVAVKNLFATKLLKKFLIPLPSLSEQSLIVSEIEKQFSRLEEATKSLKSLKTKLETYKKSVLKAALKVKSPEKTISEVCIINPPKKELKDISNEIKVSFIPMAAVSENGEVLDKITRKLKEVIKGFTYFKDGDVILAKITPCFENGKKALLKGLENGIGFGSTEFHVIRPKSNVLAEWIFYNISREDFRSLAIQRMSGAVGQQRVPKEVIEQFLISVPSIGDQTKIIQELDEKFTFINKIEKITDISLNKIERLRKSILKSAFEGKLTNGENK